MRRFLGAAVRRAIHSAASSADASAPAPAQGGVSRLVRRQNQVLSQLIRSGQLREARRVFDALSELNVVTWNSMIGGYVRHRELAEARRLFDQMPQRDVVSWNSILAGYALSRDRRELEEGRRIFEQMPKKDTVSWNTMISGYARNGLMEEAMLLFGRMPQGNAISWNTVMTGFLGVGDVKRAIELFDRMPVRDEASLNALVSGLLRNGRLEEAEEILLKGGTVDGIEGAVDSYNTLIAGYGQKGKVEEARRIFDMIPCKLWQENGRAYKKKQNKTCRFERNVVTWNSMIMCYVKAGDLLSARKLFDSMPERDSVSWNTMIAAYSQATVMDEAESLFHEMPNPDPWTWNSIIHGFMQKGDVERAREFFDKMPQKSLVSWNTMIAGYEQNEDYEAAVELFAKMLQASERPDKHTLSSVLSACAGLVTLYLGAQIHQLITKTILGDTPINNSLITMYSRCGSLEDAKVVFDRMELQRDVISWNAMIAGYAQHGLARDALELFQELKDKNVKPTYITFIAVLNACGHSGLVAEGRREFRSMINEFGIAPRVEHYASLVDLIGRHGELEEAMDVINSMAVKPDKAVWGALLGACRVHNNMALAQVAAEALVVVEPDSSAPYVLLHNMHVDEGRWVNATEVRVKMDNHGVVKQPGYSWIEIHNTVQIFVSGDTSHALSHEILSLLESCNRIIKDIKLN